MHLVGWAGIIGALLFLLIVHDQPKQSKEEKVLERLRHGFEWREVWAVLKNPQNWILTFYSGLCFTPVAVFGGLWGTPFLQAGYGFDNTTAAWYISMIFIGLGFGSPALGLLSDKLNTRKTVMLLGSILALASILVVIYVHLSPWLLASCLFIFGFSTGSFMLSFALARDINKLALAATAVSLINTGDGILGSFTEPMIGRFLDVHSGLSNTTTFSLVDYHYALIPLPIYVLVGLLLVLCLKERAPKQQ
jgi:MFS family permease